MAKRVLTGVVVSHKMNKTAMVQVKRVYRHPIYKKDVVLFKKYAAHDEHNAYTENTEVRIEESRPLSKTKHWKIIGPAKGEIE